MSTTLACVSASKRMGSTLPNCSDYVISNTTGQAMSSSKKSFELSDQAGGQAATLVVDVKNGRLISATTVRITGDQVGSLNCQ